MVGTLWIITITVEEEHEILIFYNGQMFSLLHFQFNSINIFTSKLKICVHVWSLVSWLLLGINISSVESSLNKQICLNFVPFLYCDYQQSSAIWRFFWLSLLLLQLPSLQSANLKHTNEWCNYWSDIYNFPDFESLSTSGKSCSFEYIKRSVLISVTCN